MSTEKNMKALSIKQPWAWLIVHGFKPIENRTWATRYRGRFLIHASKTMTRGEYNGCCEFVNFRVEMSPAMTDKLFHSWPQFEQMKAQCGGIVGAATITDCVTKSESSWFVGPVGFVIAGATPLPFQPCNGALGFFDLPFNPTPNT